MGIGFSISTRIRFKMRIDMKMRNWNSWVTLPCNSMRVFKELSTKNSRRVRIANHMKMTTFAIPNCRWAWGPLMMTRPFVSYYDRGCT